MEEAAAVKKGRYLQVLYRVIPYILLFSLAVFVLISSLIGFFPETFGPIFSDFISLREGGIYADCSLAANKNNRICTGILHQSDSAHDWSSLQKSKKALPFSLHGDS